MKSSTRRFLTIVFGTIGLACLLGICLDLVTANVAVEYFSVHHPRIVPTDNPWVLAVVWGIGASWWFGALSGVLIGTVNSFRQQPLPPVRILKWTLFACVVLWLLMIAVLVTVLALATTIPEGERRSTFDHDRRLVAVAMAHQVEYLLGGLAVLVISLLTWFAKICPEGEQPVQTVPEETDAPEPR